MNERPFTKSIMELYRDLDLFKKIAVGSLLSVIILGFIVVYLLTVPAIVINENSGRVQSYAGERREIVITEAELKKIAHDFIKRRYEWDQYTPSEIITNIAPIVTSGLKEKLTVDIKKQSESFRAVSQYVGKVQMNIDPEGNIVGAFDKILRITGNLKNDSSDQDSIQKIPLLSEAQVLIKVVRGSVTPENPLGLYINSVVTYENN